jgi:hypothetical protein
VITGRAASAAMIAGAFEWAFNRAGSAAAAPPADIRNRRRDSDVVFILFDSLLGKYNKC